MVPRSDVDVRARGIQVPTSEPEPVYYQHENHTLLSMTTTETPIQQQKCKWTCELTNDRGYVVYSALGSFYIPMFVMLFFYWRIYRAAVRTTRAINQGFKTTKGKIYTNALTPTPSISLSLSLCYAHSYFFKRILLWSAS